MYLEYVYTQELTLSVDLVRAIPKLSKVVLVCTVLITAIAIGVRRRFGAGFVERRVLDKLVYVLIKCNAYIALPQKKNTNNVNSILVIILYIELNLETREHNQSYNASQRLVGLPNKNSNLFLVDYECIHTDILLILVLFSGTPPKSTRRGNFFFIYVL